MSALRPSGSPPTQVRLRPRVGDDDAEIADLDLSRIDDDPITYFLTPAGVSYDEDAETMDFEMDFDAGIEDAKHPPIIVRSVSPSSLEGLSLPPPRTSTPPRRSVSPDPDRDMPATPEDHESCLQLAMRGRHPFGLPFSLRDFASGKPNKAQEKQQDNDNQDHLFSPPADLPCVYNKGGSGSRSAGLVRVSQGAIVRRGRPRAASSRRSPHAWREPSPDVWSISEETEEELTSEAGDSAIEGDGTMFDKGKSIDIPAAKPKKRVRFVLPDRDVELGVHT